MTTPIISVDNLSKAYRIGLKEDIPDTFVGAVTGWLKAPLRNWRRLRRLNTFRETVESGELRVESQKANGNGHSPLSTLNSQPHNHASRENIDTLWALRNVSFEIHEGDVVGIIGRNGAGKSTLLKVLSRITEPTHGRAVIRGRVASLLEVGTGFHPELTGRENVYMNGTILGMRKREIARKFDEIVDFSGVEQFLDTPMKRYSSGMQVRLAFAVAAHLEPEILIIDEVLAVGDVEFQKKCLGKMHDVARGGRTVLFVSHNMAAVESLCTRGIALSQGMLESQGDARTIVSRYLRSFDQVTGSRDLSSPDVSRKGSGTLTFDHAQIETADGEPAYSIPMSEGFQIRMRIRNRGRHTRGAVAVGLFDERDTRVCGLNSGDMTNAAFEIDGHGTTDVVCRIPDCNLMPGRYRLNLMVQSFPDRKPLDHVFNAIAFQIIESDVFSTRRLSPGAAVIYLHADWQATSNSRLPAFTC